MQQTRWVVTLGWCILLGWLALATPVARAQPPVWSAAQTITQVNGGVSTIEKILTVANGDMYLVGRYSGSIRLGPIVLTSSNMFSGAGTWETEAFVARWSASTRQYVWALKGGGTSNDVAFDVAVGPAGVYVTGEVETYTLALRFGNLPPVNTNGASSRWTFIAKITEVGLTASWTWVQYTESNSYTVEPRVAVVGTNVYVTNMAGRQTVQLGPINLNTGTAHPCTYVAKLIDTGSSGSFRWALPLAIDYTDHRTAIWATATHVYVAGEFGGPSLQLGSHTLLNAESQSTITGSTDVFVAKLLDAGNAPAVVWAQSAGGWGRDELGDLAVVGNGVYLTGGFNSRTANFGPIVLQNPSSYDAFVAKLLDTGPSADFVWAQQSTGRSYEFGRALVVRGNSVYVAGNFQSTVGASQVATVQWGAATTVSRGQGDIFVAKLLDMATNAQFAWAQAVGGGALDYNKSIALRDDEVLIGGRVSPAASFGSIALTNTELPETGFVATLTDPLLTTAAAGQLAAAAMLLIPNPTHGWVQVVVPTAAAPATTLSVLDALGRPVRTIVVPLAALHTSFDLTGLAPGLYLVRLTAGSTQLTRRLVVE